MGDTERSFASRVDIWIAVALALGPLTGVAVLLSGMLGGNDGLFWTGVATCALVALIYGGLVFPMGYTVGAGGIAIRSGLMRIRIPWDRVDRAEPSSNPLSSPALSLRRIRIDYRKAHGASTFVLISPVDRQAFLAAAAAASPVHEVRGDTLVVV